MARWKVLTCVANQFELEWRCAVRFKYRWMTRLVVDGRRRLLVQRHARWGVVAEAEQRLCDDACALRAWRDFAVPAAAAAPSAAHAGGLRLRHCCRAGVRAWSCTKASRTRRAVSHRCFKTQAVHLNAWCEYVAVRVSRRLDKAARLASLCLHSRQHGCGACIAGLMLWREWLRTRRLPRGRRLFVGGYS